MLIENKFEQNGFIEDYIMSEMYDYLTYSAKLAHRVADNYLFYNNFGSGSD
jgi:NADH:ubiquinone oxidoreductase subunit E